MHLVWTLAATSWFLPFDTTVLISVNTGMNTMYSGTSRIHDWIYSPLNHVTFFSQLNKVYDQHTSMIRTSRIVPTKYEI